ncbi:LOW QUALITY PROTEIN: uncharacterized protein LOC130496001 [Raphanus sativus]|uniref:LOW QUALITY PROTEIN: uncharacterized protein LOC130496001 n=1 Tax=Raphanus sativus TaxID=3726 RepID=A0A9W3BWN2_RAPSA|nr:LOW QUALITY PROTEIN: uncharacterized protein LOC130496001 [Raphanus sativus]
MGGKGEKRREKNYLAADGRTGETPFKLCNNQNVKPGSDFEQRNGEGYITSSDQENDVTLNKGDEKRKMNQINDLRFEQELAELDGLFKRKERKNKYWEAKKQKKNQGKTEDTLRENFQKHEQIRFGDVVQAPPKLAVVPKVYSLTIDF